jgi:hypothetical protein
MLSMRRVGVAGDSTPAGNITGDMVTPPAVPSALKVAAMPGFFINSSPGLV